MQCRGRRAPPPSTAALILLCRGREKGHDPYVLLAGSLRRSTSACLESDAGVSLSAENLLPLAKKPPACLPTPSAGEGAAFPTKALRRRKARRVRLAGPALGGAGRGCSLSRMGPGGDSRCAAVLGWAGCPRSTTRPGDAQQRHDGPPSQSRGGRRGPWRWRNPGLPRHLSGSCQKRHAAKGRANFAHGPGGLRKPLVSDWQKTVA